MALFIRLTSVLSMNAAISSSVVLASRLADDQSVFALTILSIQAFGLFPILRRRLQVRISDINEIDKWPGLTSYDQSGPTFVRAMLTVFLVTSSVSFTAPLSSMVTYLYTAIYVFAMFVAPGLLMWAQRYKKYVYFLLCLVTSTHCMT